MVNPDRTQVHFCTCGHRAFMFGFTRSVDPALRHLCLIGKVSSRVLTPLGRVPLGLGSQESAQGQSLRAYRGQSLCPKKPVVVQLLSHVRLFATHGLQHARLLCPSVSPGGCSSSCLLNWRCCLTILSSSFAFSFCLQSFQVSQIC